MSDLPPDLVDRGFRLKTYDDGTMRLISSGWGVSLRCATLQETIACTRRLVKYLEWLGAKEKERNTLTHARPR